MATFNFFPFFCFLILFSHPPLTEPKPTENGEVANSTTAPPPSSAVRSATFKPGILAIVGIFTTIFSITFLLLMYIKHCKRSSYVNTTRGYQYSYPYAYPPSRRNSGIDRKVIMSLPMFRFSSLRGQKDGLECAVCLNRFDSDEVLRLLPKCKHAFHVECIDTWLEAHSTCPLCRYRVDPEDVLLIFYNQSNQNTPRGSDHAAVANPRISGRHSSAGENGSSAALKVIVENPGRISLDSWNSKKREQKSGNSGSRSLESWKSFRKKSGGESGAENLGRRAKASRKDGELPVQGEKHRLEHRIIISEGRRWSDVEAAELLYLKSEMLLGGAEGEGEGESGSGVINERSVSEITGMSRYRSNNGGKEERERQEERVVKRWLAWISQSQHHQNPAVHSATSTSSSSSILL